MNRLREVSAVAIYGAILFRCEGGIDEYFLLEKCLGVVPRIRSRGTRLELLESLSTLMRLCHGGESAKRPWAMRDDKLVKPMFHSLCSIRTNCVQR